MMKKYKLFDISKPKQWKTISSTEMVDEGLYPVYGANGIIGNYNKYNHEKETVLITCRGATCGEINLSKPYSYINGNAMAIDDLNESIVTVKYLYYYFKQFSFKSVISGSAQPQITRDGLKNVVVLAPDIQTQNKIVSILDKASALIAKREQNIKLLDELLTATFLDMFGDPVINPKKWEIKNIEESVLIMRDGPFGSNLKTEHYTETGVRIIRLQNIGVNQFLDSNKEYVSEKHALTLNKHICLQGDIIVGTLGEPNLRACKFPIHIEKAINKADCIQIRPNLKIANDSYLSFLLNLQGILFMVSNYIKGQTRTRVSKGMLAKINIPIPPIELQNQFSNIEVKFEKIKEELSNKNVPNFFQSLLQRAFNGDLNFNIDEELNSLLKEIDLQKKKNDLSKISNDTVYLQRLIDKLNNQEFEEKDQYDKAKHTVFQLLKEGKKVTQQYKDKRIQLAIP